MRHVVIGATVVTTALILVLPFVGGGGPGLTAPAVADSATSPVVASGAAPAAAPKAVSARTVAPEHTSPVSEAAAAAQPAPAAAADVSSCPAYGGSSNSGAPGITSAGGVSGTTSDDLASFAATYNSIRADNCLAPVSYFVYDSCMEQRLFWMAEDPSEDPSSAWGHLGSQRSDGVPSVGCDGNLAGGYGNDGAEVASKWWESPAHQASLYRPGDDTGGVCIAFAMTHGGIPNEPYEFTRAAARWTSC